ncbi:MAG: YceI family protein [Bacteroidetes bacterium]|nr:YceI family protein [Bacteroidota bacterium]
MSRLIAILILSQLVFSGTVAAQATYGANDGVVHFHSNAPHELIRASSDKLQCLLDAGKKQFAFRLSIRSFMGFNSPLQREHFNENYLESERYPEATFSGKIIEDADLSKDGEREIRAKGKMAIHGMEQERIIKGHVSTKNGRITIHADFIISLADHNIKIPRVVYDKLAPDISVTVDAVLKPAK